VSDEGGGGGRASGAAARALFAVEKLEKEVEHEVATKNGEGEKGGDGHGNLQYERCRRARRCPTQKGPTRRDEDRVRNGNEESPKEIVRKVLRAKKLYHSERRGRSTEVTEKGGLWIANGDLRNSYAGVF
jgi:hypothetical protein